MRSRFIVAYDISDTHRLRKTHRVLLGFGDPLQYSVFDCRLSDKEVTLLVMALSEVINVKEDSVLLVKLGRESQTSVRIRFLGKRIENEERKPLVI
jgi:CRISPR-associated protein Cas2